jgi:sulfur carrier protein
MKITVNGSEHDAPDGSSVTGVVTALTGRSAGVAVALNDEVVPRADWDATIVREADRIEVLTAVQGG